jgi:hypothetical protein
MVPLCGQMERRLEIEIATARDSQIAQRLSKELLAIAQTEEWWKRYEARIEASGRWLCGNGGHLPIDWPTERFAG